MIRLGHIDYSNCVPIHAPVLDGAMPGVELVRGVPSELNAQLADGGIDVAPCSSIEYARHSDSYSVLRGLTIASHGPVRSILLESAVPLRELDGSEIAVPTASATSIVLLRCLLEQRLGVRPILRPFDQADAIDPIFDGAAAALRIGDAALRVVPRPGRQIVDLGAEWAEWTGLPFAYAIWQVGGAVADREKVAELQRVLVAQRDRLPHVWPDLVARYAPLLGLPASLLLSYWTTLHYELDEVTQRGLLHFYRLAADLGEAPRVNRIEWFDP